ncbi:MAG: transcription antitermination factor NusB [Gammaproteobacteria bacterium]|nr:transcription antitermination factor NusB [Gammaproteobacteria bacterium]MDH3506260.1 transcription antitermination factor NusB [Gammaproteobacteria bacterium]
MARARRGARELLVKALYQWQLAESSETELREQFAAMPEFDRIDQSYFTDVLGLVMAGAVDLDAIIAVHANRDATQQDAVGRAILLTALAELQQRLDVPTKVVINEAVELAKRYGPVDSHRFVNAVLDKAASGMPGRDRDRKVPER